MDESSCRLKSRNPLAFRSASRLVVPLGSGRFARSRTITSPEVWLHQSSENRPGCAVQPVPKARPQAPEPGTRAPLGPVKNRPMVSLQQLSPQGLSLMVTVAAVMQGGRLVKVCTTAALTVQSSKPLRVALASRNSRTALGDEGSGPTKSSVVVPAS